MQKDDKENDKELDDKELDEFELGLKRRIIRLLTDIKEGNQLLDKAIEAIIHKIQENGGHAKIVHGNTPQVDEQNEQEEYQFDDPEED
jgi:hypothetical protein